MKRRMVLIVGLMAAVALVASAQMHGGAAGSFGGPNVTEPEEVELTGRLQLERDQLPALESAGREYTLRIAPALSAELDVVNGQEVTVSGYLVERASRDLLGTTTIVMVRTIEVDGTRYVMPTHGHMGMGARQPSAASPRDRMRGRR